MLYQIDMGKEVDGHNKWVNKILEDQNVWYLHNCRLQVKTEFKKKTYTSECRHLLSFICDFITYQTSVSWCYMGSFFFHIFLTQ